MRRLAHPFLAVLAACFLILSTPLPGADQPKKPGELAQAVVGKLADKLGLNDVRKDPWNPILVYFYYDTPQNAQAAALETRLFYFYNEKRELKPDETVKAALKDFTKVAVPMARDTMPLVLKRWPTELVSRAANGPLVVLMAADGRPMGYFGLNSNHQQFVAAAKALATQAPAVAAACKKAPPPRWLNPEEAKEALEAKKEAEKKGAPEGKPQPGDEPKEQKKPVTIVGLDDPKTKGEPPSKKGDVKKDLPKKDDTKKIEPKKEEPKVEDKKEERKKADTKAQPQDE